MVTGDEGLYELEVLAYLIDVAGAAGIVSGGLDTAGQSAFALESDDVVSLPAVKGNLLFLK